MEKNGVAICSAKRLTILRDGYSFTYGSTSTSDSNHMERCVCDQSPKHMHYRMSRWIHWSCCIKWLRRCRWFVYHRTSNRHSSEDLAISDEDSVMRIHNVHASDAFCMLTLSKSSFLALMNLMRSIDPISIDIMSSQDHSKLSSTWVRSNLHKGSVEDPSIHEIASSSCNKNLTNWRTLAFLLESKSNT